MLHAKKLALTVSTAAAALVILAIASPSNESDHSVVVAVGGRHLASIFSGIKPTLGGRVAAFLASRHGHMIELATKPRGRTCRVMPASFGPFNAEGLEPFQSGCSGHWEVIFGRMCVNKITIATSTIPTKIQTTPPVTRVSRTDISAPQTRPPTVRYTTIAQTRPAAPTDCGGHT